MTTIDVESQLTFLYDTLIDLATSADRQAARAAEFDDTMVSSALFTLADQLRTMARTIQETPSTSPNFELLDTGRRMIATAMLRFDAKERMASAADPQSPPISEVSIGQGSGEPKVSRVSSTTTVALHLAAPGGRSCCGVRNPSHVTDGIRYVDCAACIAAAQDRRS